MGCSSQREKLENEMMNMQIMRLEVQMEKYNLLKKLSEIDNQKFEHINVIPDYIDPKFAVEKKIYIKNNSDKKTDLAKKINNKRNSRKSKIKMK
jgi:hypothetical protein